MKSELNQIVLDLIAFIFAWIKLGHDFQKINECGSG